VVEVRCGEALNDRRSAGGVFDAVASTDLSSGVVRAALCSGEGGVARAALWSGEAGVARAALWSGEGDLVSAACLFDPAAGLASLLTLGAEA
jgi:hypothetical protein